MSAATGALAPGTPGYRRFGVALFLAGFATFIQVFAPQAFLPEVVTAENTTPAGAALLISGMSLGLALSVLPWASLADRIGHVSAMRASMAASTVLAILSPLLPTFELTVGGRIVGGLLLGAIPGVAMAYIAESITPKSVGLVAGTYVAGNTLGGILGRLIAGPLAEVADWRTAMLVVAGISAAVAVVFLLVAPKRDAPPARDALPLVRKIGVNLRDPYMLGLYAQGFFLMGAFVIVYNFIGFELQQEPIGLPPVLTGFVFLLYLFGTVASRRAGALVRRIGRLRTILVGIALMLAALPLLTTPWLVTSLLGLALFTIGCFTAHPTASSLSGQSALAGRNQATAMYQMCFLGGTSLFGWLGGVVFSDTGWHGALLLVAGMCVASAALGIAGLGLLRNRRPVLPTA